jgi:hypothetical protein
MLSYMIISNAVKPKKYPTKTIVIPHPQEPSIVYSKNFLIFIFNNPAGTEIISLNTGTILPNRTALSPYFSNHLSTRSNFFSEILTLFKYFSNTVRPNFSLIVLPLQRLDRFVTR